MENSFAVLLSKAFGFITKMWAEYSYWLIAVVGLVFLLMIPINALVKLIFKKACKGEVKQPVERIRKMISSVLVYFVSLGVLYLYQYVRPMIGMGASDYAIGSIIGDVFYVGVLAMIAWSVFKFVVQVGLKPVCLQIVKAAKGLSNSSAFKAELKKAGVDPKVGASVIESLNVFLADQIKESDQTLSDYVKAHEGDIRNELYDLLTECGKVESGEMYNTLNSILEIVKGKYVSEK